MKSKSRDVEVSLGMDELATHEYKRSFNRLRVERRLAPRGNSQGCGHTGYVDE